MKKPSILRKITCIILASAMMLTTGITALAADKFETAESAVSSITAGWNLGNALDSFGDWITKYSSGKPSDYETAWGNPVTTKKLITAVKNAGFNAVRVPVTWGAHIDENGNINKEWLDRVQEVVDYVITQDMYCVLNVHHDAGADGWLEASVECSKENSEKFSGLWKNIAERFKSYDEKLIFESFNEMLDDRNSWTEPKSNDGYDAIDYFNQLFVNTVRKTGGNNAKRNLMVQVYSAACTSKTLNAFKLPPDSAKDHLIIQVHNYDPAGFTNADASWTKMTDKWGTDSDKRLFDDLFERLGSFSKKMGAPIVVGEFAAEYKNNDDARAAYAEYFVKAAAKKGIKCFWWDTGGMALFDRSSCTVTHPKVVKALTSLTSNSGDSSTSKLPAPKVTAKKAKGRVTLKWDTLSGADCYMVYRYDANKGKYVRIKTVKANSCTISKLKKGSFKFIVCAAKKAANGYTRGESSKAVKVEVRG